MLAANLLRDIDAQASIVVLTGAGISAASGVPTFRGPDGLWRGHRSEELATPAAFRRDPRLVWEWYEWRRTLVAGCRPNAAHEALVRLERGHAATLILTQNVDGLHRVAGSTQVVELHGDLFRVRCIREGSVSATPHQAFPELPPHCACGALLRPDVVWFGEPLNPEVVRLAFDAARKARLVLVVGTSALVEPAASLPFLARGQGARLVEVNTQATPLTPYADQFLAGDSAAILPAVVDEILRHLGG